jgi:hypothetical protein
MILKDNKWVDDNNNSWDADIYTQELAEKCSKSLTNCSYCSRCSRCSDCSGCSGCSGCSHCSDCSDCSGCSHCSGCSEWEVNPQRIISPILGSRKSQTIVYFDDKRTEVICGCFRGTLDEFRLAVIAKYGEEHEYIKWINKVQKYMED